MKGIHKHIVFIILCTLLFMLDGNPAKAGTMGVIMTGDIPYYQNIHKAFVDEISGTLGEKGLEIILQKPMPDAMSWVNAARKLVTLGSEIIVAYGVPATLTTMKETSDIPIVFAGVYDPNALKIPGKNATGVDSKVSLEEVIKKLGAIKKVSKLGVVFNKSEKDTILQVKEIKKLEGSLGFTTVLINVKKKVDASKITGIDGLLITSSSVCMKDIDSIIGAARGGKIPTAAIIGGGEDKGVVLTITSSSAVQAKELSAMVKEVLGGAAPSGIAVKKPAETEIIINGKEAGAIGVTIPADLQSAATKVIQ
jgi:putative ABC transport system substrate-binding protein